jgi:hypothetical protein
VDVPSGGVLGALVHIVTLAVLQERLLFRLPPILSLAEYRTLEGGSKSRLGGDTTGEIDLAVLTPKIPTVNQGAADVYELKPDDMSGQMRHSKAHSYQSEPRHYSKYFPTDLGPLGKVVEARPGGIIEDLDRAGKSKPEGNRILHLIEFRTPLGDIRINLRLQDSEFEGHKVRGLILYQVQVRPKNDKATRQLAEEAFKWFIAYQIAKQMGIQAAKSGKSGQSQSQPAGQHGLRAAAAAAAAAVRRRRAEKTTTGFCGVSASSYSVPSRREVFSGEVLLLAPPLPALLPRPLLVGPGFLPHLLFSAALARIFGISGNLGRKHIVRIAQACESLKQDYTATAQDCLLMAQVKTASARVWKRNRHSVRSVSAIVYSCTHSVISLIPSIPNGRTRPFTVASKG